jgi:ribosome-associated protein
MRMKKNLIIPDEKLLEVIIESIKSKKGKEIVSIDLRGIEKSVCNYFVICHAESTTQVSAIAEEIRQKTKEDLEVTADHIEGQQNSFWILLDYISIVVHVFINDQRHFYQLEDLWADGILSKYDD